MPGLLACDDDSSGSPSTELESPPIDADSSESPDDALSDGSSPGDVVGEDSGPCIPDCEGKFCGDDGCGVLCGICDEGFACTEDAQCEEVCEPQVSTTCVGNATYWVNGCGIADVLKEQCSTGTQCQDGICLPCTPQAETICEEQSIVWVDSCGNPGEVIEECGAESLCVDGACVDGENPLSGAFSLSFTPNELEFPAAEINTTFPNGSATLLIDGAGTVTLSLGEGLESISEQVPQFLGSLASDQFSAGGMFVTTLDDGTSLERSFMIQALFVDDNTFQGTLKEWLILDGQGPPIEGMRDMTGTRMSP